MDLLNALFDTKSPTKYIGRKHIDTVEIHSSHVLFTDNCNFIDLEMYSFCIHKQKAELTLLLLFKFMFIFVCIYYGLCNIPCFIMAQFSFKLQHHIPMFVVKSQNACSLVLFPVFLYGSYVLIWK